MNPFTDINIRFSVEQSKGYALLMAFLPIVMMYRTPGLAVGLSTSLIALGMIYALCVIYLHANRINLRFILPFSIYIIYSFFMGNTQTQLLSIAIFVHLAAISTGAINGRFLRRVIEYLSIAAAIGVTIQQILHVFLGIDLQMMYSSLMIESLQHVGYSDMFGESLGNKMYRPSAFFIEPSHLAQYCSVGLASCLFRDEAKIKQALLVTLGLMMSTSGIGIVLVFAVWGWWYLSKMENQTLLTKVVIFVGAFLAVGILLAVLYQIPFFQQVFGRFIGTGDGDYNAIEGRTYVWKYVERMNSEDLVWGMGDDNLPLGFLTDFVRQLLAYGIVGCCLFYFTLLNLMLSNKGLARTVAIMYAALSFVANQAGFILLIFQVGTILTVALGENTEMEESEILETENKAS